MSSLSLFEAAYDCLMEPDPDTKMRLTHQAAESVKGHPISPTTPEGALPVAEPGRPKRPLLVHPRRLQRRTPAHGRGRAALIHAIAHIEFNAVNLAWDAVYRFRGLPSGYYLDWVAVAADDGLAAGSRRPVSSCY